MDMLTGKEIRKLREKLGMTPTEFGYTLGVSSSTVTLWQKDLRHPSWKHLVKLNDLLKKAEKNGHGVAS